MRTPPFSVFAKIFVNLQRASEKQHILYSLLYWCLYAIQFWIFFLSDLIWEQLKNDLDDHGDHDYDDMMVPKPISRNSSSFLSIVDKT